MMTSNNKILLLLSLIVCTLLIGSIYKIVGADHQKSISKKPENNSSAIKTAVSSTFAAKSPDKKIPVKSIEAEPVSFFSPTLISPVDIHDVMEEFDGLDELPLNDGRLFIQLDTKQLRHWQIGSDFQITFDDLMKTFTGKISKITEYQGIRRFTGYFEEIDDTDQNQFSFTLAKDQSYVAANFSLPEDSFTLEVKNNVGWINNVDNERDFLLDDEFTQDPDGENHNH